MAIEIPELVDAVLLLVTQHTRKESIQRRNQTVRQVRYLTTQLLQSAVQLGLGEMQGTRKAMADALHESRKIAMARCTSPGEQEHLAYCIREVQLAFEMAEQIATEYGDAPDIAQILIHDLPIFRPFDYNISENN